MAAQSRKRNINKPSIKYRHLPLESASYEFSNIRKESKDRDACLCTDSQPDHCEQAVPKSNNVLKTSEFVSLVGGIWNSINQHYSIFQSTQHVKDADYRGGGVISYSDDATSKGASKSSSEYFTVGLSSPANFHPQVNSELENLKAIQRTSLLEPCTRHDSKISSFWGFKRSANFHAYVDSCLGEGSANVGLFYDLRNIYRCVFENPFYNVKDPVKLAQTECKKPAEGADLEIKATRAHTILPGNTDCKSDDLPNVANCKAFVGGQIAEPLESLRQSINPLYTSYSLGSVPNIETFAVSRIPSLVFHSEYQIKFPTPAQSTVVENSEESSILEDKNSFHNEKRDFEGLVLEDGSSTDFCLSLQNKSADVVAKRSHAIAGALAGTVVSLCLHPVDTVKTVIQAHNRDPKSISSIFRSIISERGLTGFYRGIMSNIASAAPISAVYTFTYESVKGAMLPCLPKVVFAYSVLGLLLEQGFIICLHLGAFGCFIFPLFPPAGIPFFCTLHRRTALVRILEGGGLSSLYAGWGAVLCRNIPHSIIKNKNRSNELSLGFKLVCGGFAACTASLFTTPFDVVKTRLQTQCLNNKRRDIFIILKMQLFFVPQLIPGSLNQYDGVLHILQDIAKREGLKGLYRYLFLKIVLSNEVQHKPGTVA
ncbi:hypothetical protein ACLOJK_015538 [Asimina triloba]